MSRGGKYTYIDLDLEGNECEDIENNITQLSKQRKQAFDSRKLSEISKNNGKKVMNIQKLIGINQNNSKLTPNCKF